MRLYEIDSNIREFWCRIAEQGGELTEEDMKELEGLNVAKDDKIKAYGVLIRELTGEVDEIKNEEKRLKELATKKEKLIDKLSNVLETFLKAHEILKYESTAVNISFRRSKVLEIDENAVIPKVFLKIQTEPDKSAIKEFLKNGGEVYGCRIREKSNMQVK